MATTALIRYTDTYLSHGFMTPRHLSGVARGLHALVEAQDVADHIAWMAAPSPLPCDYCGHIGPRADFCDLDNYDARCNDCADAGIGDSEPDTAGYGAWM